MIAVLACLSMGFFARSPQFFGSRSWITMVFMVSTLALSLWGFRMGMRGVREQRTTWSWLAPGINAFIFLVFGAFVVLIMKRLASF